MPDAQPLRLDLGLAAHQALRHLGLGHLKREERDGHLLAHPQVGRRAEREAGLAHARTRREDDQVARLEAGRQMIQIAEAGRHARHVDARLVELRDALEALLEQLLDVAEVPRHPRLREVEDDLLGAVDELGDVLPVALHAEARDLAAGPDQAAQRRHLAHDPRVVGRIRRRGNQCGELVYPHLAADVLELAAPLQLVDEGDRVHRLASPVEGKSRPGRSSRDSRDRSRWPRAPR